MEAKTVLQNLVKLRTNRHLSQEQMAEIIGVSRPTYINIESGKRELTISEVQKIADFFQVSVYELYTTPRNTEKFRQMYFYILDYFKRNGKSGVPKTKLAKLLYLTDFRNFFENLESMSGVRYVRKTFGPVADVFLELTDDFYDRGEIEIDKLSGGAFMIRSLKFNLEDDLLTDADKKMMDEICDFWKDRKTKEIVNFTHEQKPWASCRNGEFIPYELIIQEDPAHVYKPVE